MIDDKGRLFGKISIIDLFVAVVFTGIIIFGVFKFNNTVFGVKSPKQNLKISFHSKAVEDFTATQVKVGDTIINEQNEDFLGEITNVELGESSIFYPDENGIYVGSPREGYSSIEITANVLGQLSNGSAVIDGTRYNSGSIVTIRAGKTKLFLKVSDISAE